MLDVEAASVIEILRQPEEQEIPCGVTHELCEDEHLHVSLAHDFFPADRSCDEPGVERVYGDGRGVGAIADAPPKNPHKPRCTREEKHSPPSAEQKHCTDEWWR